MSDDTLIAIVAIGCVFGAPMLWFIVDSIASNWRKVQVAEQNAILKRDLIERGFSADEIVRILDAGTGKTDKMAGKKARNPEAVDV